MSAANGVVVNAYRREDEQWKECWNIRVAVFVDEQGFTMEQELDECVNYDQGSVHLLALHPETRKPIGTARYIPSKGKIGRMAVLSEARGLGIGKNLMLAVEPIAIKDYAAKTLSVSSQIHAMPFYHKLGYREEGEVYDEDGAPHKLMVKELLQSS